MSDDTLTYEHIQETMKLMKGEGTVKEQFFKKFFPKIKDFSDYSVVIPKTGNKDILDFVENNHWLHIDKYAPQMIALDMSWVRSSLD